MPNQYMVGGVPVGCDSFRDETSGDVSYGDESYEYKTNADVKYEDVTYGDVTSLYPYESNIVPFFLCYLNMAFVNTYTAPEGLNLF